MTTFLLSLLAGVIGGIIASLINEFILRPLPTRVGLKRATRQVGDAIRRRKVFRCPDCGSECVEEDWGSGGWLTFEDEMEGRKALVTIEKYKCTECHFRWEEASRELR